MSDGRDRFVIARKHLLERYCANWRVGLRLLQNLIGIRIHGGETKVLFSAITLDAESPPEGTENYESRAGGFSTGD